MAHQDQVLQWITMVSTNLPHLSAPQARLLALLLGRKAATLSQQLQEWLLPAVNEAAAKRGIKRRTLLVETCFAPLLAWVLRLSQTSTLALAVGASTLHDRFVLLVVRVV